MKPGDQVEYGLVPAPDGLGFTVTLSFVHRQYLLFLASRGGETVLDYGELASPQADHIKILVKCDAIKEYKVVGLMNSYQHKLTSTGINLVTEIERRGEKVGFVNAGDLVFEKKEVAS